MNTASFVTALQKYSAELYCTLLYLWYNWFDPDWFSFANFALSSQKTEILDTVDASAISVNKTVYTELPYKER